MDETLRHTKARVLVVDDNADNRDLLSRRLKRRGYETVPAADGQEALDCVGNDRFDLVLLDIRMPGMDGIEVLRHIRERSNKIELPIIMVTAETDSAQVVRAISLGANDYVTKPIDFPVVLARVEAQLSLKAEVAASLRPEIIISSSERLEQGFLLDGRYEIEDVIGEGGFAVVYRALQRSTGQKVAVKVLRADHMRRDQRTVELARFEREIRMIHSVSHPNIIRLIDSGRIALDTSGVQQAHNVDPLGATRVSLRAKTPVPEAPAPSEHFEIPYLVTELLEGQTLQAELRARGKFSEQELMSIMLPVLSAAGAAHRVGIVHRDLTPANVFLARGHGGVRPRILDFGIAKLTDEPAGLATTTSSVIGTPHYMSPEQARGEKELTGASDQYTLAVVCYECLTGKRPYDGETFISVLQQVGHGEFSPPRHHDPTVSQVAEAVLLRAMSLDPNDRFPDTESMGRALLPLASERDRGQWAPVFEAV
ncbi:MAG: response regulator [Myxococcales bacterium]|nr:response regulator [Myxococcales bacterium]